MAKILNPREPVWFTPSDQLTRDPKDQETFLIPEEDRVQYQLKAPSHWDEINLEKAKTARGARRHGTLGQIRILRAGVEAAAKAGLFDEAMCADFLEQVDGVYAAHLAFVKDSAAGAYPATTPEEFAVLQAAWAVQSKLLAELDDLTDVIRPGYAPLGKALADDAVYAKIVGMESARIFVIGWRNRPGDVARDATGLRADLVDTIPMAHIVEIGQRVEELLKPTETEAKNSDSPSLTALPAETTSATASNSPQSIH